jgi:hypothetical protein
MGATGAFLRRHSKEKVYVVLLPDWHSAILQLEAHYLEVCSIDTLEGRRPAGSSLGVVLFCDMYCGPIEWSRHPPFSRFSNFLYFLFSGKSFGTVYFLAFLLLWHGIIFSFF